MSSESVTLTCPQKFSAVTAIPKVELSGMNVVVNGKRHSLSRKGRSYRVVRAFFANVKPSMSSSELIDVLDQEEGLPRRLSVRAKASQHTALVRLLSRIREEFNDSFKNMTPNGTSWFHYDRAKNTWVLFKMPSTGADGLLY